MKGAKSEKRKKIKHKPTAVYLLKLGPSLSRLTKGERHLMGIQEKKKKDGKLNFITTFALPPFPERGAVKEVIYIYGKRTVAIFLDTWLIDGISSACS